MDEKEKKIISKYFTEIGRKGGLIGGAVTKKRYGYEHYRKLAEHMNKVKKEKKEANKKNKKL